ncbi:MAG: fumarylacetoacetate hydrolase family protein [Pseudomonadota bacterium]
MRLVTYTKDGATCIGAIKDGAIVDFSGANGSLPADMLTLLQGGDALLETARALVEETEATIPLDEVTLQSPIPNPPRVLAVGINYMDHFLEIPEEVRTAKGLTAPKVPVVFNKQTESVTGPYAPVMAPPESAQLDYEAELAVVIGRTCRRVSAEDAHKVIMGYTILNDVSVRDWQLASMTMTMGKSWDSHCPMGPALVTADEVTDPQNLQVRLTVDGEEQQNFNTGEMIFNIAQQIEYLSTACTLLPGDVIATGTSAGVALFREGQPWLTAGQTVRVEIEGLGHIENQIETDPGISFIQ